MKRVILTIVIGLWLVPVRAPAQGAWQLNLEKTTGLGRGDFFFASIEAVAEDREGNIFVLDRKAYKVYRFSPDGRLLLSDGHLFVFLVKDDVRNEKGPWPVDVFDLPGKFLGSLAMPIKPLLVTGKCLYTVTEEDENLILTRHP